MLEIEGTIKNGVVELSGDPPIAEGTKVLVSVPSVSNKSGPTFWQRMREFAEECGKEPIDLPEDYSINHDHYLYGTPKRQ